MALTVALKNAVVAGATGAGAWLSLHSADPGTTGASEISGGTYARVQTTYPAPSGGSSTGSVATINVPASTTVEFFGVWSASTGGTFLDGGALPTQETYAAAGVYALTHTYQQP